jgi:hypothetical protein
MVFYWLNEEGEECFDYRKDSDFLFRVPIFVADSLRTNGEGGNPPHP